MLPQSEEINKLFSNWIFYLFFMTLLINNPVNCDWEILTRIWTQNVWKKILKLLQKHIFNELFVEVTSRLIGMPFTLSVIYQICPGSVLHLSTGWEWRFVQRAVVLSINLWLVSTGHISVWRSVCLYMRLTWSMIPCSLFCWKGWLSPNLSLSQASQGLSHFAHHSMASVALRLVHHRVWNPAF